MALIYVESLTICQKMPLSTLPRVAIVTVDHGHVELTSLRLSQQVQKTLGYHM